MTLEKDSKNFWRDSDDVDHRILSGDQTWCLRWSRTDLNTGRYLSNIYTYYATCLLCAVTYLNINNERFPA